MGVVISKSTLNPLSFVSTIIGFISFAFTLATFVRVFWGNLQTIAAAPGEINDYMSTLKQGLLEERRHLRKVRRRMRNLRRYPDGGGGGGREGGGRGGSQLRSRSRGPYGSEDDEEDGRGPPGRTASQRRSSTGANGNGYSSNNTNRETRSRNRDPKRRSRQRQKPMYFDRDMQSVQSPGEAAAVETMKIALRDMIQQFKHIERPFLKAEYQNQRSAEWSTQAPYPFTPEKGAMDREMRGAGGQESHWAASERARARRESANLGRNGNGYPHMYDQGRAATGEHDDDDGESELHGSNRMGMEYRRCGFKERYLWLKRKQDVITLSEALSRLEIRRTAHEVGEVLTMVGDIGRDVENVRDCVLTLETRLNRVVGVRRVD